MNLRTVLVIVLAIVCGVASAVGVNRMQDSAQEAATKVVHKPELTKVVMAKVDVPLVGTEIRKEMVSLVDWPKGYVPNGALTKVEDAIGQTAHIPLVQGELILEGKIGAGKGLAALLENGRRAFTISTPSVSASVAGFILPTDHVDIYLTRKSAETYTGGTATSVLLQNVSVIAVGQMLSAPADNKVQKLSHITLSVTPQQVATLTMAQKNGTLTIALRAKEDYAQVEVDPVFWREIAYAEEYNATKPVLPEAEDLAADASPSLPRSMVDPPQQIRTFRGNNSGSIYFQPLQ